jgi:hypothetical protein
MAFGGGVDIPIGHVVATRPAEIDYLYTNFTNRFNNSNQNNFRIQEELSSISVAAEADSFSLH